MLQNPSNNNNAEGQTPSAFSCRVKAPSPNGGADRKAFLLRRVALDCTLAGAVAKKLNEGLWEVHDVRRLALAAAFIQSALKEFEFAVAPVKPAALSKERSLLA